MANRHEELVKLTESLTEFKNIFTASLQMLKEEITSIVEDPVVGPEDAKAKFAGFGDLKLRKQVYDLVQELEKLPPCDDVTNMVCKVSEVAQSLQSLQNTGKFFWPRLTAYASIESAYDGDQEKQLVIPVPKGDGSGKAIIVFTRHHDHWVTFVPVEFMQHLENYLA